MGFCQICSEPDGASIYGIWAMLVGACSQQSLPRNGWLTSNGQHDGRPWAARDLALKFRRSEAEIERSLQILSSQAVGWVKFTETETIICHPSAVELPLLCHPSAVEQKEQNRTEGTERKKEKPSAMPSPPSGEHKAFADGWCQNFRASHGFDYVFSGSKDGRAVSDLLKMGILRIDLLEIAKRAWARNKADQKAWNCKQAETIAGFRSYINQIRSELENEHNAVNRKPNPRNVGIDIDPIAQGKRTAEIIAARARKLV